MSGSVISDNNALQLSHDCNFMHRVTGVAEYITCDCWEYRILRQ